MLKKSDIVNLILELFILKRKEKKRMYRDPERPQNKIKIKNVKKVIEEKEEDDLSEEIKDKIKAIECEIPRDHFNMGDKSLRFFIDYLPESDSVSIVFTLKPDPEETSYFGVSSDKGAIRKCKFDEIFYRVHHKKLDKYSWEFNRYNFYEFANSAYRELNR